MDIELIIAILLSLTAVISLYLIFVKVSDKFQEKNNAINHLKERLKQEEKKVYDLKCKNEGIKQEMITICKEHSDKMDNMRNITNELECKINSLKPKKAPYIPY